MDKETFRRNLLAQARQERLRRLVELTAEGRKPVDAERYRNEAEQLAQEIEFAEDELVSSSLAQTTKYANCKLAKDAILAYLDEVGTPVSEEKLETDLTAGGFRGGSSKSVYKSVMRSILANTHNKQVKKNPCVKKIGDLVGRIEWEESRFKVPKERSK